MSIFGHVFNNSAEVTPSLEGQGEDVGTENVNVSIITEMRGYFR